MGQRYWLMKCEPSAYTIDDLARDGQTCWEGVRNYQARNLMRDDMGIGDGIESIGVDEVQWQKGHKYFDERSTKSSPVWFMVDIRFVERFNSVVSLATLKTTPNLDSMMVTRKGSRLSVQPVSGKEFDTVVRLGRRGQQSVSES